MNLHDLVKTAMDLNASDLFIVAGTPLAIKVHNDMMPIETTVLSPAQTKQLVEEIYALANHRNMDKVLTKGDDDFSFSLPGIARFRVNVYTQRSSLAAVLRVVRFDIPSPSELMIPDAIMEFSKLNKGLVLISGPAGSGKSTTMATLLNSINHQRKGHIITLEDPIEYLHKHGTSIVSQREIETDCESTASALRAALRQAPDVLFVGEMRDLETIALAITAAETGHLVFSTLHTLGASNTIDRIIDVFPPLQQQQIRVQLSMVLQAVISQQLVKSKDGKLIPVFELMINNTAIRNQIREGKTHQLTATIRASSKDGMWTMDSMLKRLVSTQKISLEEALDHAFDPINFEGQ